MGWKLPQRIKQIAWHSCIDSKFIYAAFLLLEGNKEVTQTLKSFYYETLKALLNIKTQISYD